jgi:hypothetical protein
VCSNESPYFAALPAASTVVQKEAVHCPGIAYDGNRFNRTATTAMLFKYLEPAERAEENLASPMAASWNQIAGWLKQIDGLRRAA